LHLTWQPTIHGARRIAFVNAVAWWLMHINQSAFGLYALWMFYVFGFVYFRVRTINENSALIAILVIHFMVNLTAVILVPFYEYVIFKGV